MAENESRELANELKGILKRKRDSSHLGKHEDENPIRSILKKGKTSKPKESKPESVETRASKADLVHDSPSKKGILKSSVVVPSQQGNTPRSILVKTQNNTDNVLAAEQAQSIVSLGKTSRNISQPQVKQEIRDELYEIAEAELLSEEQEQSEQEPSSPPPQPKKATSDANRETKSEPEHVKEDRRSSSSKHKSGSSKSHSSRKEKTSSDKKPKTDKKQKPYQPANTTLVDDYDDDDEIEPIQDPKVDKSRSCPYLDTINRSVLDFDFEKLCSVSLSHINVYACLVCGKYFQGRGKMSHAYTHSVLDSHHVFLNLLTHKFYCLPDNYEIIDSSLEDIIYVLNPTFTIDHIKKLDFTNKLSRAYDGTTYNPGIVGLNNIKANDYCNVILQALSHVSPLRNYFLQEENYKKIKRPPGDQMLMICQRFGELIRKLWNPRNFKAHVSPHEMLQSVVLCSKKKFQITEQGDSLDFMSWFLNALHVSLNGTRKLNSSIVNKTFRGKMRVYTRKMLPVELKEEEKEKLLQTEEYTETYEEIPWLYLTCDLPPPPLYPDELRENIIPQVPFSIILAKFNGISEKEYKTHKDSNMKRFELTRLPPYIICYIKRFTKNYFIQEKNRTIVNFPIKNIDFGDLLAPEIRAQHKNTTYDLMANIVHDGEPKKGKGTYRVHVIHKGLGKWYEMQDLHVTDILPQMIPLSESYIQIFELRKDIPNPTFGMAAEDQPPRPEFIASMET
ncbi:U4/U6.U5 tri-snRNP-associated protein 2-like [Mizuhopecten yessoensis]|uniref:Ubiquitin carboxyl-terminal hydrolase 39 n=1 Tax=Mizuhopecten yessoensis TaxID=6573 RepID=A0A210Q158_MIZYE|nr:U4/U6.U5 tri-snRNP-associated protein 2-like [Mizuhopecten yessoensis]OWF42399.1 U4/U6.U5 tri-snRNP-associated protein 2 [Mizuhopecten yessoensis]